MFYIWNPNFDGLDMDIDCNYFSTTPFASHLWYLKEKVFGIDNANIIWLFDAQSIRVTTHKEWSKMIKNEWHALGQGQWRTIIHVGLDMSWYWNKSKWVLYTMCAQLLYLLMPKQGTSLWIGPYNKICIELFHWCHSLKYESVIDVNLGSAFNKEAKVFNVIFEILYAYRIVFVWYMVKKSCNLEGIFQFLMQTVTRS